MLVWQKEGPFAVSAFILLEISYESVFHCGILTKANEQN